VRSTIVLNYAGSFKTVQRIRPITLADRLYSGVFVCFLHVALQLNRKKTVIIGRQALWRTIKYDW